VGINTQFHITDAIQFISNEDKYVILDPLCKHFPNTDSSNPGKIIPVERLTGIYSDVLTGFNFMPLKDSTMFRFSLRSRKPADESNWLSKEIHTAPQMKQIMLDFASRAYETLFFLKSVRKISFYELDENNNLRELECHKVAFESENDKKKLSDFWIAFRNQIRRDLDFKQIICRKLNLNLSIDANGQTKRFHVRHQFGFEDLRNTWKEIDSLQLNKSGKFFPLAGIAFHLGLDPKSTTTKHNMYSFLPLHQESPLACHVNGFFALHHENRTQLFENSRVAVSNKLDKSTADWCTDWNTALIDHIVMPLCLDSIGERKGVLIDAISSHEDKNECDKLIEKFLKTLLPSNKNSQLHKYFEFFVKEFYKYAKDIDCIPMYCVNERDVRFFKPSQLLFSDNFEKFLMDFIKPEKEETNEICESISKIVREYCRHGYVVRKFKKYGDIELRQLEAVSFLAKLKVFGYQHLGIHVDQSIFKSVRNVVILLKFCIHGQEQKESVDKLEKQKDKKESVDKLERNKDSADNFLFLDKVPLMITSDNIIREFSQTKKVFHVDYIYIDICFKKVCIFRLVNINTLKLR
jgi:hypothetical protein